MDDEDVAPDVVVGPAEEFVSQSTCDPEMYEAVNRAIAEMNSCGLPADDAKAIRMTGQRHGV
jgi:hypothetical protein